MNEHLQGPREAILALMDITRRQWQVEWRTGGRTTDKNYVWPTGGIRVVREEAKMERFLREQE